tara:strand:+ start:891 stop:1334 length:444 start_codon:yes stop_codon:yes gene_type:complete
MSTLFPLRRTRLGAFTSPLDLVSIFDDFYTYDNRGSNSKNHDVPKANIIKTSTGYSIELAAPGFSRDEFEMTVDNGRLTVSMGTEDSKDYEDKLVHREYQYKSFNRGFSLPEDTNIDAISARYEAGILYIDVPVEEKYVQKRVITVE